MVKRVKAGEAWSWTLVLLGFGLLVFAPWILNEKIFAQSSPGNPPGILRGSTEQGYGYMTGGIGLDEREVMESWGAPYNLKLSFAELSGVFLSDVGLSIMDENGREIIRTTTNGPWFYIKLPPGTYNVNATFEDDAKEIKNLHLPKGQRVSRFLHWDLD